jgi:transposase-like protein
MIHSRAWDLLMEMQADKVPCIACRTITNTDVHVEYRGGIAVFTKYVCPNCKHEFMEKDLYESNN